jgi:uncharacterized protein (TIGR03382 family)
MTMMMRPRTVLLGFGAVSLVVAGLVACSSNNSDPGDSDEAALNGGSCTPPTLHSPKDGPFCPFMADAAATSCAANQHCCNSGVTGDPAVCLATGTACAAPVIEAGVDWQCDSKSQCGAGQVCCYVGDIGNDQCTPPNLKGVNAHGSVCRTSCGTGEHLACADQSECTDGTTCAAFKVWGKTLGTCAIPNDAGADSGDAGDGGSDQDGGDGGDGGGHHHWDAGSDAGADDGGPVQQPPAPTGSPKKKSPGVPHVTPLPPVQDSGGCSASGSGMTSSGTAVAPVLMLAAAIAMGRRRRAQRS